MKEKYPKSIFDAPRDWYANMLNFEKIVMLNKNEMKPHIPSAKDRELRITLIKEEVQETLDALANDNLIELTDGIADSIVVLLGTAITYGIDMRPVWELVHKANMEKVNGELRADGKRLKPFGWKHPDIAGEIERQSSEMLSKRL